MFGRKKISGIGGSLNSSSWYTVAVDVEAYLVKVNLVALEMSSVGTNANKIKIIASRDQNGDEQLITETESRIFDGITTAAVGCASYRLDSIMPATDNDTIYFHFKLNDETATLDQVFVTYEV